MIIYYYNDIKKGSIIMKVSTSNNIKPEDIILPEEEEIEELIKSKVIVIDYIEVTITEKLDGSFSFDIKAKFAPLSDGTIPDVDINGKEGIDFDEDLTLAKLEKIIRRCGILEKYEEYFTNDPEIVINCYRMKALKEYNYFNEFKDGVLTCQEIFE
jgi:hypothetical protein